MLYSPSTKIRKDWVAQNQASHFIQNTYAKVLIDGQYAASGIKNEFEFDIVSLSQVDEIDPMFLSTPIPHGTLVLGFNSATLDRIGFYDNVLQLFSEGMSVEGWSGYSTDLSQDLHWFDYIITEVKLDAIAKEITIDFEHSITTLDNSDSFPFWFDNSGLANNIRQIAARTDTVNLETLVVPDTDAVLGVIDPSTTDLNMITYFQNTLPFQLVTDNDTGLLTAYYGFHPPAQDVRIWESEVFSGSIEKEAFSVGLEKRQEARQGGGTTELEQLAFISGKTDTEDTDAVILGLNDDNAFWENFNYSSLENTLNAGSRDTVLTYTHEIGQLEHYGYQTIQCSSHSGSRCIFSPMPLKAINADIPALNTGTGNLELAVQLEGKYDINVFYRKVDTSSDITLPPNVDTIKNPFGANIEACYTYPKDNFLFLLKGKMRDNPSYKPGQVIKVPYGTVWADMLITKTSRTFTGSSSLSFEGIILRVTDIPVLQINDFVFNSELSLVPASTANEPDSVVFDGKCEQGSTTGKNLLVFPYYDGNSKITGGVTFTVNPDGSVHAVGTATRDATFYINNAAGFVIPAGTYTFSGCPSGGNADNGYYMRINYSGFILSDIGAGATGTRASDTSSTVPIYIRVRAGATVNHTFYPQLELGSTATAYEPYTGGAPSPNPSYPQAITTLETSVTTTGGVDTTVPLYSLPDGTCDTYDAVTGVLTHNVGKYTGASGTSWTISNAANNSPFMCDKILAGTLSGQTLTALSTCTPTVYYKLATPTTEQFEPNYDGYNRNVDFVINVEASAVITKPPLWPPDVNYTIDIDIPNHDVISETGVVRSDTFSVALSEPLGILDPDDWANATGTITIQYKTLTGSADMTKGAWALHNDEAPTAANFNAGEANNLLLLPSK